MHTLAVVIVLTLLIFLFAYNVSKSIASIIPSHITFVVTNASNAAINDTYTSNGTYYTGSTGVMNMIIYDDNGYLYALFDYSPMITGIDGHLNAGDSTYGGSLILCLNPYNNRIIPLEYYLTIKLYKSANPGVNCQNTQQMPAQTAGSSKTAIGPISASNNTITF